MTDDQKKKWDRLIYFARHPKTIPHGEIEVRADLLVAADDLIRQFARRIATLTAFDATATPSPSASPAAPPHPEDDEERS